LNFEGNRIVKEGIFAIERSTFPVIYLREVASQTSDVGLISFSGTIMTIGPLKPTGQALLRLDPRPGDGVSSALFQFFRTTNTTGARTISFYAGDGTGTVTHLFNCAVGGAVNLNNQGGICYIGAASARLQVQNGDITFQTTKGLLGADARPLYNSEEIALLSDVTGGGALPHTVAVEVPQFTVSIETWTTILDVNGTIILNLIEGQSTGNNTLAYWRVYIDSVLLFEYSDNLISGADWWRVLGPGAAEYLSPVSAAVNLRVDCRKSFDYSVNFNTRLQYQVVGF